MANGKTKFSFTIVLGLSALALLGYLLLPRLSIRWQPGPARGGMSVNYYWPGADPASLERQLTAPLEAGFALLGDVEKISSVSRRGSGRIQLEVDPAVDQDFVRFNIASTIRRLYPSFPEGAGYPTIDYRAATDDAATENPVLIYTLSGPSLPTDLYRYAREQLAPRLSLREGLERIEIRGGNRKQYRLVVDPDRLGIIGINYAQLTAGLSAYFERDGLGLLRQDGESRYVFLADAAKDSLSLAEWATIPIPSLSDQDLVLGDLATITYEESPPTAYYRVNGSNNLRLVFYATATANQLQLSDGLSNAVGKLQAQLPSGYQLELEKDNTKYLREELAKTRLRTTLSMGILLFFVLLVYRSWRQLLRIFFSLAVNLGLAFLLYFLIGVELNLYAFAGIAVSFGIMVDNVIIMLAALQRPTGGKTAAAIFGATLTTVAGLSVIWLLDEALRHQLFELGRVMVINLMTSLLVAIYFVPALFRNQAVANGAATVQLELPNKLGRWGKLYQSFLIRLLRYRKTALLLAILAFGLPVFWLPRKVVDWNFYNQTIGSDYYQEELRPYVNRWLGGSFRLFSTYVYEKSGYREPKETRLYVNAALPEGATVDQLNEVLLSVEAYLATFGGQVDSYVTQVTSGQYGRITIDFPEGSYTGFPFALKSYLTAYAVNFGGVEWDVYGVGQGFSNGSNGRPVTFRVELRGYEQAGLDEQAGRLAQLLLKHPRVAEVDTDANLEWWQRERSEFLLTYSSEALALRQRSPLQLQEALHWFDRSPAADFVLPGGEGVLIMAERPERYDRWNLENRSIPVDSVRIEFSQLGQLQQQKAPLSLHKEDQQYLRLVAFDYRGSGRFGSRHLNNCLDTLKTELPLGFTVNRTAYSSDDAAIRWLGVLGLAVALIFFICALLFESLRQALSIVLLVPFSFIGVFLTFYLFDIRLDQGGYTSFLFVTGLSVNGIILITDEYNGLKKTATEQNETMLYVLAFGNKFMPVLLTILSTAAGLLPFLLSGTQEVFWYGLAAGTIGGLLFSILLLVVVCPLFLLRRKLV